MQFKYYLAVLIVLLFFGACAANVQANPYLNAGDVTSNDVPVEITGDRATAGDTSSVVFEKGGGLHP